MLNLSNILTGVAIVAVIFFLASFAKAADVFKVDYAVVEMDIETKEATGKVNFKVVEALDLTVATDETFTLGISLTEVLKLGKDNFNIYLERSHPLRGNLLDDAENLVGLRVNF